MLNYSRAEFGPHRLMTQAFNLNREYAPNNSMHIADCYCNKIAFFLPILSGIVNTIFKQKWYGFKFQINVVTVRDYNEHLPLF